VLERNGKLVQNSLTNNFLLSTIEWKLSRIVIVIVIGGLESMGLTATLEFVWVP